MSVKNFENNRWSHEDQKLLFRHRATLNMITEGSVLDLGSGDGLLLSLLKEKGIHGKGLDISEQGIEKAKAKGLDATVFDFSNRLPFEDNTFDTVIMLDLLEHLYNPEFLLSEARRVSKENVIVGVPNFNSLPARIQTLLGRVPENNHPKKGHLYWFNYYVLTKMFTKVHLKVEKIETNTFYQSIPVLAQLIKILSKVMPNLFTLSFVVLGKKIV